MFYVISSAQFWFAGVIRMLDIYEVLQASAFIKMFPLVVVVTTRGLLSMNSSMLWDFGMNKVDLTVIHMLTSCGPTS